MTGISFFLAGGHGASYVRAVPCWCSREHEIFRDMQLVIHDNLRIEDVQDRFSECFPGLNIEFYRDPKLANKVLHPGDKLSPDTIIGDIRKEHRSGILEIKSWYSVDRVEEAFKTLFGLNVQVFHCNSNQWVQTSNRRTLKEQIGLSQAMTMKSRQKATSRIREFDFL